MGEEQSLEFLAEMPEGCAYRLVKHIPIDHPAMDDSLKQYVAQARLEAMCMIMGIGDTPEEAKADLASNLALELERLDAAKYRLNDIDEAVKLELHTYLVPASEPEADAEKVPAPAETPEAPREVEPAPYGGISHETEDPRGEISYDVDPRVLTQSVGLIHILTSGDTMLPPRILMPGEKEPSPTSPVEIYIPGKTEPADPKELVVPGKPKNKQDTKLILE